MVYQLSASRTVNESPRAWWLSLGISLGVHLLLLAAIAVWTIWRALEFQTLAGSRPTPEMEMAYTGPVVGPRGAPGTDPVANILESIPERIHQMQKLTTDQKVIAIKQGKKDLAMVSESSLHEIADLFNVENRAYEPADIPPAGVFDIDSQIPYSMKETENGAYIMLLLDKDGRTLEITYPAEEVTDDLRAAAEIFKMMDEMPALRKVYMRMAVKFLPELMAKGAKDE